MRTLNLGPIDALNLESVEPLFDPSMFQVPYGEGKGLNPSLISVALRLMSYVAFRDDEDGRNIFLSMAKANFSLSLDEIFEDENLRELAKKKFGEKASDVINKIEGIARAELRTAIGPFPNAVWPTDDLNKSFDKGLRRSRNAGMVLSLIRSLHVHHGNLRGGASLNKVIHMLDSVVEFPRTEIMSAWASGKSVIHLGAAYFDFFSMADEAAGNDTAKWANLYGPFQDIGPCIAHLGHFLALAKSYQEFGLEFIPTGSKTPLLDPEVVWRVPDDLKLPEPMGVLPVNGKFLEAVTTYKAPKSL
jgi:hypothetical protein